MAPLNRSGSPKQWGAQCGFAHIVSSDSEGLCEFTSVGPLATVIFGEFRGEIESRDDFQYMKISSGKLLGSY